MIVIDLTVRPYQSMSLTFALAFPFSKTDRSKNEEVILHITARREMR